MKITVSIKSIIVNPQSAMRATASVTLNDEFMIHNVRLITRNDKTFVSMPSVWKNNGWKNTCHPTKSDLRIAIEEAYIAEYEKQTAKAEPASYAQENESSEMAEAVDNAE